MLGYSMRAVAAVAAALCLWTAAPACAATETIVHYFTRGALGWVPNGNLIEVNGGLFGTTQLGGVGGCCGTVFRVDPQGGGRVVYTFKGGSDGSFPSAGLIELHGVLYGVTNYGGGSGCGGVGCGTVFSITPQGSEKVVYSFQGGNDGAGIDAGLINVNGTLYGTTISGGGSGCGGYGCGTVFSVTPDGKETVIYSFQGGSDGANPGAGLLNMDGTLYGTTVSGGSERCGGDAGCGTVFAVTLTGNERIVHSFGTGHHGGSPRGGLVRIGGELYGTTSLGSKPDVGGTVFAVKPDGREHDIYAFKGGSDGAGPAGDLIAVGDTLYGTTTGGGSACNCGTVFSLTREGTEAVLYAFNGGSIDGSYPATRLLYLGVTLYGATGSGGLGYGKPISDGRGFGTVFAVTP